MPRFPHLDDNQFPYIRTVDVYQFQNEFDYTRWNENTTLRLCNVAWDSTYDDVVKFDDDIGRDYYFDNIDDSYTLQLATAARLVPEGFVKLPIPYDIMSHYNYLSVDMPIATSVGAPIDYENAGGKRRWYFFIDRLVYLAPSTTQVFLTLDVWTNFANDLDIKYMLLERGHAPVAYSDTDTYLSNPMENNDYLLAPDVSFDEAGINRSVTDVPFGYGKKYVCIASTCAPAQIAAMGSVARSANYNDFVGPLSYSDVNERYGYQLEVSGFTLGNGYDYSNARTCAMMGGSENGMLANNLEVYCIEAKECYGASGTFFEDVVSICPQFLNTVQGCFVVAEECLTFGTAYRIAGHTVYLAIGSQQANILTKQLTKQDFDYPSEYENFAKLYTAPYAVLEITNNAGKTTRINIEETTTLTINALNSIAFPYVESLLYVSGIRGTGSAQYTWRDLRDVFLTTNFDHSDWFDFCFKMDIPTFALYMDGETAYCLHNFNRAIKQGINDALVAYHNHVRSSNTAMENARDSADAAEQNAKDSALANKTASYNSAETGKTNAYANATTAKTNADDSANVAKTNSYNDADTAKTNANNNATAAKTNADSMALVAQTNTKNSSAAAKTITDATALNDSNNVQLQEALKSSVVTQETTTASLITSRSNNVTDADTSTANTIVSATAGQQNDTAVATSWNNAVGQVVGGMVSGAVSGGTSAGLVGAAIGSAVPGIGNLTAGGAAALGGAVVGAFSGGVQAASSLANTYVVTNANSTISQATQTANTSKASNSKNKATNDTNDLGTCKQQIVVLENATTESIRQNNLQRAQDNATTAKTTTDTNADNTYNATIAADQTSYNAATTNAQNSYDSKTTNADNNKNLANANAARTETNSKNCADRTEATSKANADLSYNASIGNAARTRETVYNNSGYTREVEILNAKETLENAALGKSAPIRDARNAAPIAYGSYSGNCAPDNFGYKGLQIKVKTQSNSAIRQAGDIFARYGYALNQVWDVNETGLTLMQHFTYWKANEVWLNVNVRGGDMVRDVFKQIFERGVTVWNSPTEIGEISVYDNWSIPA